MFMGPPASRRPPPASTAEGILAPIAWHRQAHPEPSGPRADDRRSALFPAGDAQSVGTRRRRPRAGRVVGPPGAAGDAAQREHQLLGPVAGGERVVELDLALLDQAPQ